MFCVLSDGSCVDGGGLMLWCGIVDVCRLSGLTFFGRARRVVVRP